ncbi:MAG TPA: hypothetical protein VK029_08390 [Pseudogracilibacillus sp.]|nr:hypothetical protein [Pseudogracilibacillus sp.]
MRYVLNHVKKRDTRQLLSVVRLEIDYELVTLYDAMKAKDEKLIDETKEKLKQLVEKLHSLSA